MIATSTLRSISSPQKGSIARSSAIASASPAHAPAHRLTIHRASIAAWPLFAPYHYLTSPIHPASRCYVARFHENAAAFCATLQVPGVRHRRRITRLVVLPEFRHLHIGQSLLNAVACITASAGYRVGIATSSTSLASALKSSPRWRYRRTRTAGSPSHGGSIFLSRSSHHLARAMPLYSFDFLHPLPVDHPSVSSSDPPA